MKYQTNIGQSFPLESLGSDIARNSFNYQSILNALIEWNTTSEDTVMVRLSKDSAPWYEDMEIPSKKSIFSSNSLTSKQIGILSSGLYSVGSLLDVAAYGGTYGSSIDIGDVMTIRLSVSDSGKTTWDGYFAPQIHDWVSGIAARLGNYYKYNDKIYIAQNTFNSAMAPDVDVTGYKNYTSEWTIGDSYTHGDYVSYNGSLYVANLNINSSYEAPDNITSGFYLLAAGWDEDKSYQAGSYIMHGGLLYLCMKDVSGISVSDVEYWRELVLLKITSMGPFTKTHTIRINASIDIQAIVLKNIDVNSSTQTDIRIQQSIKTMAAPSIYQRSTGVHSTSNYSFFPTDISPVWSESSPINNVNETIDITKRQDYSAVMVFDHTNQKDCRTINFINYDGPDLDQGLCVYLPVEVELASGELAEPEDGYTLEFYFRIWPNTKLTTDTVTRDHIVNKAQIYVYNSFNIESVSTNTCSYPIAKFSMARMANFHVFAENISIPDKPVVYRATFIFSASQKSWVMMDYYQLPDHVFVGPIGFIDPANPATTDMYVKGIDPDAGHIGYETTALPTYVDVFSKPDLNPYKSSDGTFFNRMI